ncbi:MAG: hypothetical protein RL478_8, partial [Actinomycetota bacterium]
QNDDCTLVSRPNIGVFAVYIDGYDDRDRRFSGPRPQALVCWRGH